MSRDRLKETCFSYRNHEGVPEEGVPYTTNYVLFIPFIFCFFVWYDFAIESEQANFQLLRSPSFLQSTNEVISKWIAAVHGLLFSSES